MLVLNYWVSTEYNLLWPFRAITSEQVATGSFPDPWVSFPGKSSTTWYNDLSSSVAALAVERRTRNGIEDLEASIMFMLSLSSQQVAGIYTLVPPSACEVQILPASFCSACLLNIKSNSPLSFVPRTKKDTKMKLLLSQSHFECPMSTARSTFRIRFLR